MKKLMLFVGLLTAIIGCTNQNVSKASYSFHVVCGPPITQIKWYEITSKFPNNFRETSREFINEIEVVSKGYLSHDLYNQGNGTQNKNLLQFRVNLNNLTIESTEFIIEKDFNIPCANCSMTVLDHSPDGNWVLAEIRGKTYGLWLLSKEQAINILANNPDYWIWSTDSTALWVSFSTGEVGGTSIIVSDIENEPTVTKFEQLENFPPELIGVPDLNKYYFVTFAPDDKTIWWFRRFSEDIYIYNTVQRTYEPQTIDNFLKVEWQPSLNALVLVYFDGETLLIESQDGNYSVRIPRETAEKLYVPFSEERFFISNILDYKISIVPDGQYIYVYTDSFIYKAQCVK